MKLSIILTFIILALFWSMRSTSADEFDVYTNVILMRDAFKDSFSAMGNAFISMGRVLSFTWFGSGNYLFNYSFSLSYQDAEYFFHKEQKARDRKVDLMEKNLRHKMTYYNKEFTKADAGKKYEYYCQNLDPNKLKDYCLWALTNEDLLRKIDVKFDHGRQPKCEFKFVFLIHNHYKTHRTFLRCPITIKALNETERESNMYISSVENAPKKRLIFYLFMLSSKTAQHQYKHDTSSQSLSIDYEPPRKSMGSVYDREEQDRKKTRDFEPSRISLGDIRESEDLEFVRASLKGKKKIESEESTENNSLGRETMEESGSGSNAKTFRRAPSRKFSITDNGPRGKTDVKPVGPKMTRATKSSIEEFQLPKSATRKKVDYKARLASMPVQSYIYEKGKLVRRKSDVKPKDEESVPLEIVTLLVNKRHLLKKKKPKD